jgi:Coenzyme F420-reducing hydrogenase, beta subunit
LDVSKETKCIGCGACEGICTTGAIKIYEVGRSGYSPFVNKNICSHCGLCKKVCPTQKINIPDDLSKVRIVYRARSNRPDVLLHGSSGGGVSSLLISLFKSRLIDAALVVFYDKKLNLYGDFIENEEDVLKHSGSFYQTSKQLLSIKRIKDYNSIAIVGLPCHIEAVNNLVKLFNLKNIYVTISLFCTIGRMRRGFRDFLEQKFNKNLDNLEFVDYVSRGGASESRFSKNDIRLKTKNGEIIKYTHTDYIGFVGYHYSPNGCFHCRKMFGLTADISIGDDWGIKIDKKVCLIAVNSERGLAVTSNCNLLEYERLKNPIVTLYKSQPNGVPLKVNKCSLRTPLARFIKVTGYLNNVPLLGRFTQLFKSMSIQALIKFSNRLEGQV